MNDNMRGNAPRGYAQYDTSRVRMSCVSALPANPVVTMAYVPVQTDLEVYSCKKALACGTLFPVLDKPFLRGSCK